MACIPSIQKLVNLWECLHAHVAKEIVAATIVNSILVKFDAFYILVDWRMLSLH